LKSYGKDDPFGYLKLLIGLNSDNQHLLNNQLSETRIWDYGITSDHINDNRLIIRINSLISFISFGNHWVNTLVFAFISFCGLLLIYKAFNALVKSKLFLFYGVVLFPTIAFWGSSITKETIFILAVGVHFYSLVRLSEKVSFVNGLLALIGIFLLLVNKPHVGILVIPFALFVLIGVNYGFDRKKIIYSLVVLGGIFTVLC